MSPVRSCAPGSISFEFGNKSSISPELSMGQVDELENFTKKPRSNSNEGLMSKPLSRSNSKDKKRSSSSGREESPGAEAKNALPFVSLTPGEEKSDDSAEEIAKPLLNENQPIPDIHHDSAGDQIEINYLGKRAASQRQGEQGESDPLNESFESWGSRKRPNL